MKDLWRLFKTYWIWFVVGTLIMIFLLTQGFMILKGENVSIYFVMFFLLGVGLCFVRIIWQIYSYVAGRSMKGKDQNLYLLLDFITLLIILSFLLLYILKLVVDADHFPTILPSLFMLLSLIGVFLIVRWVLLRLSDRLVTTESQLTSTQSELKLLQSQLSPHFLFNTLNSIYGLTLQKSDKAPVLVLKLSDLLRYSVYDTGEQYVPLSKEIDYLKNYIDFEKVRLGDRLELSLYLEEGVNLKIAPMLLMVFVENAFKHARNSSEDKIFVDIVLKSWEKNVLFSIENSFEVQETESRNLNAGSGLGLENAKRRLELMYPKKHTLSMRQEGDRYKVSLQIETE